MNMARTRGRFIGKEIPFTSLPNAPACDPRLGGKAKGYLWYLLTKPANWFPIIDDVQKHMKDGREAVQSGLKELRIAGYAELRKIVTKRGMVIGWDLVYDWAPSFTSKGAVITVHATDEEEGEFRSRNGKAVSGEKSNDSPETGNPYSGHNPNVSPETGKPDSGDARLWKTPPLVNKEVPKKELGKRDSAPVGAAPPAQAKAVVLEPAKATANGHEQPSRFAPVPRFKTEGLRGVSAPPVAEAPIPPPEAPKMASQASQDATQASPAIPKKARSSAKIAHHPDAKAVLAMLNAASGLSYREVDTNLGLISARLREPGITVEAVGKMIERQAAEWKGTTMAKFLRPETLFRASKFEGYYAQRDCPIETADPDQARQAATRNGVAERIGLEKAIESKRAAMQKLWGPHFNEDPHNRGWGSLPESQAAKVKYFAIKAEVAELEKRLEALNA